MFQKDAECVGVAPRRKHTRRLQRREYQLSRVGAARPDEVRLRGRPVGVRPNHGETQCRVEPRDLDHPPHTRSGRDDGEVAPAALRLASQAYDDSYAGGVDIGHGREIDLDTTSGSRRGELLPDATVRAVSQHEPPRRDQHDALRVSAPREMKA